MWGGDGGMWPEWGRNVYRIVVGKPKVRRSLGRRRYRWEDNIKMDFEELGLGVELIHLAYNLFYISNVYWAVHHCNS
jgi:hypothetical protein